MDQVIVTENLSRTFGEKTAVDRLNLTVQRGEVFGFLGPNGAGKTTTIRLLNGVLAMSEGSAQVLGFDVATQSTEIRRRTGVLTETPSLYEPLTAKENLLFFGDLYGVPSNELGSRVDVMIGEFGLGERADDRVGTYSKGMRQKLTIARALLHEPPLLFLDEPTASLDPSASRMVIEMIRELSHQRGRTIFLCTHNLAEAQELCDRVGIIDKGILQAVGTPQELARQLWKGFWVKVDLRGEPTTRVRGALKHMPGVLSYAAEDGKLLIELDDEEKIPDLVTGLCAAGGRIFGIIPREHSLEEVYFKIRGENRPDDAEGTHELE